MGIHIHSLVAKLLTVFIHHLFLNALKFNITADQVNKSGQAFTGLMKFTLQPGRTGGARPMSMSMSSMASGM
jgi:hypothetical protein